MTILILICCYILLGVSFYSAIYSYGKYNYHKGKAEAYGHAARELEAMRSKWIEGVLSTPPEITRAEA